MRARLCGLVETTETNNDVRADGEGGGKNGEHGCSSGCEGKAGLGVVSDGGQQSLREADLARTIKCLSRTPLDRPAAKSIKTPS